MNSIAKHLALGALVAAAAATAQAEPYKVIVPATADDEGATAYIINYDNGDKIDSVLVAHGQAAFTGEIDEPVLAQIRIGDRRVAQIILESGTIGVNPQKRFGFGSMLNDRMKEFGDSVQGIAARFGQAPDDAAREAILAQYNEYMRKNMMENLDNPIGYSIFMEQAYEMTPEQLNAFLADNPSMAGYERVKKLVEMNKRKAESQPGAMYKDFDINGQKLSQYVGKDGKYLLVDFFASWCGPCMREIKTLKDLYAKYSDKNLEILGVAVWDEPAATEKVIKQRNIPWPCILDAQAIPTDIYGISGIPCIMLISPEGKILLRDLQGEDLVAEVEKILNKQ